MSTINSEEWEEVQAIFLDALEHPDKERTAYVWQRSKNNKKIYDAVVEMLSADEDAPAYFDEPPDWLDFISPSPGMCIGSYEIQEEIGRGGMGRVYLARKTDSGIKVALKMINPAFTGPDTLKRFLLEQRVMARLNHPNIARLIEVGFVDEQIPYLVLEYIRGFHIVDFCETHALRLTQRLAYFQDICNAIYHAHQNRIVHRDLKPSNILITKDGMVKVLDFGIAKLLEDDGLAITRTGQKVLTPAYAAPEQLQGLPVTNSTDIYTLGLLLHELLTGKRFSETEPLPFLSTELKRIIDTCTQPRPEFRYGTVLELNRAVQNYLDRKL